MIKPQVLNVIPNVESFLRHCQRKAYKAKSTVLKQGEVSDSLYLILEGSVSVMVEDEAEPEHMLVVSYLNPGDFVGEMGLFDEEPPVGNPLLEMPQVIATPHLLASTFEAQIEVARSLAAQVADFFVSGTVHEAVNPAVLDHLRAAASSG